MFSWAFREQTVFKCLVLINFAAVWRYLSIIKPIERLTERLKILNLMPNISVHD